MLVKRLAAILTLLVLGFLAACSHDAAQKAPATPKRVMKDANDLPAEDAKRPRLELSPPEPALEVIASEGNCAPKHENELAVGSCYQNQACRGQWARSEKGGRAECWCYASKGGCAEGTICCSASRRCEKPENCYVP
jgi:hypothetical protein